MLGVVQNADLRVSLQTFSFLSLGGNPGNLQFLRNADRGILSIRVVTF